MNASGTTEQTVLLAGLLPPETALIRRLIASFELEALSIDIADLHRAESPIAEKDICLALFHVDAAARRPERDIRLLAELLPRPVPLIVLVPPVLAKRVQTYIAAGADDYSILPLDEDSFSIRFYILLEWGQALLQSPQPTYPWDEHGQQSTKNLWRRLVARLQEGLSFFSPASLVIDEEEDRIFHKWRKIRLLGSGAYGDVWLVQEDGRKELAAAKIPHTAMMNVRTLRSAAILKRLIHHPNIAGLIEVVKEEGMYILIQEYVAGESLDRRLEKGLTATARESLFLQLLSVTAYSHQHRIMHRDIKPENILVTGDGRLKLLDFGIARDLSWEKADAASGGTLNFMAPEQFEGKSCLASDVWAIGVILYVLATGCYPLFHQENPFPAAIDIPCRVPEPHEIDDRVPAALERIIMRCLDPALERRYADAVALREDILKSLPGFGKGLYLPEQTRVEELQT
ncbi:serine/threonine protein kinase [Desulfoprunum benzoelyticum]|uniref:Protein kinase domain-containing protein n=1 Tax=Desulfoprunum benzoelyticum TaxID=1506996 RepID=A0A840UZ76_9BACT|nr:serine/threonine-protein kinase [Desulfoprunum benzoelyticum]MBB5348754.1 hypothetical protein [Desulfoprunum benzoelyticum]MBM9529915.1 serine/threonine protein kinase [Desulfoprunum benzoelyticum]